MAKTVNEKVKDEIIGHSVDLNRLEVQMKKDTLARLKKLEILLIKQLEKSKIWKVKKEQTRRKELEAFLKNVKSKINDAYMAVQQSYIVDLTAIARIAEKQTISSINKGIKSDVLEPKMSKQMLKAIASNTLIEGAPSKEWWKRKSDIFLTKFKDVVRKGMSANQTTDEVVSALVGTKVNKFKDGALYSQYRGAEALIRTSIQTVANQARIDTYRDNDDLVKGIEWSATFDSQTSETCMALDGLQWDLEYNPIGHGTPFPGATAHWNCRSTTVGITKSWKELGAKGKFKEIPKSTRASMDGQVSGKMNYEGWLKTKDSAFQKEVLGSGKYKLWKEEKLGFTDMVSGSGKPLTLGQLENKLNL